MGLKTRERDVKRAIIDFLRVNNVFCWVNVSGGIYDPRKGCFRKLNGYGMRKGVPDILGIFRGKPLAIEVKLPGNGPSKEQQEFISEFSWYGGIAFVATSIEEVRKVLAI